MMQHQKIIYELILVTLKRISGVDFTHYALPAMERRIDNFLQQWEIDTPLALLHRLLTGDKGVEQALIQALTITYTRFFRNEDYFRLLFEKVIPALDAFPRIKIWSIACSSGEEVYSLAMLLKLGGLLERASILGTDINTLALKQAKKAVYPADQLNSLQENFRNLQLPKSDSILDMLEVNENDFSFSEEITKGCHFTHHNMLTQSSMGQMNLICCRNALLYLSRAEQDRVITDLILPSLSPGGFLMMGEAENLRHLEDRMDLRPLKTGINLYQLKA